MTRMRFAIGDSVTLKGRYLCTVTGYTGRPAKPYVITECATGQQMNVSQYEIADARRCECGSTTRLCHPEA